MNFENGIKRLREYYKPSNAEIEKSLGLSNGYIAKIEKNPGKLLLALNENGISIDWFLTGEGEMLLDESISRFNEKTHQARKDSEIFKIPLLTREDAMLFDPDTEIPPDKRKANSGEYPATIMAIIPPRVMEYSTDLRAIMVFDSRMAPTMKSGDIAIIEATGWNGDGIYLYRMGSGLHFSYVGSEEGCLKLENKINKEIVYDASTFKAIGRVRAVVKDLSKYKLKGK